jgi:hypothetical protein
LFPAAEIQPSLIVNTVQGSSSNKMGHFEVSTCLNTFPVLISVPFWCTSRTLFCFPFCFPISSFVSALSVCGTVETFFELETQQHPLLHQTHHLPDT